MARRFTPGEARELIAGVTELVRKLDSAASSLPEFDRKIEAAVNESRKRKRDRILSDISVRVADPGRYVAVDSPADLAGHQTVLDLYGAGRMASIIDGGDGAEVTVAQCARRAWEGVRLRLDVGHRTPDATAAVSAAYAKLRAERLVGWCGRTASRLRANADAVVDDLQVATGVMKWLFSSRERKENAERAYDRLSWLSREIGSKASAAHERIASLRLVPSSKTWSVFSAHQGLFFGAIERVSPGCLGYDDWKFTAKEADDLVRSADTLVRDLTVAGGHAPELDQRIRGAIDAYMAKRLLRALGEMPVEELARERRGIRLKALRQAGYSTMSDVYTATPYNLEAISGVSSSTARDIARVASQYADQVKRGLKLHLSTDDRSPEATAVVCAVHNRMRWELLAGECVRLASPVRDEVIGPKEELLVARKALSWLLSSAEQRGRAESAYERLSAFLDGELAQRARLALDNVKAARDRGVTGEEAWAGFSSSPVAYFNILESVVPGVLGTDDVRFGLPEGLAKRIQEECLFPDGLLCTLRRYQEWGVKYILHQEKVLLGDEMGLGKTVQAIAAMVSLRNVGATHFIVICPASVLENWCREIRRHSRLGVTKVHGRNYAVAFESWRKSGGVAVTTYETTAKLHIENSFRYGFAVVDEAHYIKNPNAARTKNTLRLLAATDRVALMTGTTLENKVDEMLTLVGHLRPEIAQKAKPLASLALAQQFRDAVAPVYYRRRREDVLTELPDLIEKEEWCVLGAIEEDAYERAVLSRNPMAARQVSWNIDDLAKSSKACRLKEIVSEAGEDGRKVLVFTYFLHTLQGVMTVLGEACVGRIDGSVSPAKRQSLIDSFNEAPEGSVLVAQIGSGGTGLNIQSASVIVICEPQYKPSVESQAIARAYRMGQTRNVFVHRLLCDGTIDERIMDLLKEKQAIFDAFADTSSAAKEDIAVDDRSVGKIIEDEIIRIKAKKDLERVVTTKGERMPVSVQDVALAREAPVLVRGAASTPSPSRRLKEALTLAQSSASADF